MAIPFTQIVPLMYGESHPKYRHVYTKALVFTGIKCPQPFVVAHNYDTETQSWDWGSYYSRPDYAYQDFADLPMDGDDDA